jgi:hypothetical protein
MMLLELFPKPDVIRNWEYLSSLGYLYKIEMIL